MGKKLTSLEKIELPREKLLRYGANRLSDYELLAIILSSGIKGKNVLEISKAIIKKIRTLGTKDFTIDDIAKIEGVGTVKAMMVTAVITLGARFSNQNPEIYSDKEIWVLCSDIRNSKKEHFLAFYMDTQDRLIERQIISIGTLDSSIIHPRDLFEPAIRLNASSVIIAHNHPSGSLDPSETDIKITHKLVQAGEILGIPIQRHLIVTKSACKQVGIACLHIPS